MVRHRSVVELCLNNCLGNGLGDEMMTSLLSINGLKVERLVLSSNDITSSVITELSAFLATDPPLRYLDLDDNNLNDNDAEMLANVLRSNTTLRRLDLYENSITDAGGESFRLVLHDGSSLNSVASSNHSCCVCGDVVDSVNMYRSWPEIRSWDMNGLRNETELNRARKIYGLLSYRNIAMSNVQHFDDIDVNLLPNMVASVQKYANLDEQSQVELDYSVNALSIVYEVMRKWDKAFPLYT